jgi:hypothetical protein
VGVSGRQLCIETAGRSREGISGIKTFAEGSDEEDCKYEEVVLGCQ